MALSAIATATTTKTRKIKNNKYVWTHIRIVFVVTYMFCVYTRESNTRAREYENVKTDKKNCKHNVFGPYTVTRYVYCGESNEKTDDEQRETERIWKHACSLAYGRVQYVCMRLFSARSSLHVETSTATWSSAECKSLQLWHDFRQSGKAYAINKQFLELATTVLWEHFVYFV